ncbi:hypothetical protein LUZ63_015999 [Rhynchospora breviuscula]|uniref:UMP kinase n=1 Tax=Rhynchospora breviuscula TaxID=2022672 RepID=A0A9Q0HMX9_9POAL|nr:hypothetical protein LUZ63_015999 [Rhynchospora breviuscula]
MASCEDDDYSLLGDGDEAHQAAASLAAAAAAAIASASASEKGKRDKRKDRPHSHSHDHDDLVVSPSDGEALSSSPSPSPYSIASRSVKKQLLQLHEEKEKERAEFRKDREEWSDGAIEALLDAYSHRFELLNRGNLRGRDWEDVAAAVSHNCSGDRDGKGKTVEQCKNKIDNLKKRYKVECHRLSTGGLSVTHWPWFAKLDVIVSANSNSLSSAARSQPHDQSLSPIPPTHAHSADDDRSPSASGSAPVASARHPKRYAAALAQGSMRVFPASTPKCKWKRVLLKVSGSALAGSGTGPHNVDPKVVMLIAREIQVASRQGIQVAVVVGGRNIFCGDTWIAATAVDRAATYQICMMASVMNAMLLQASLEKIGVATRVQTALTMQEVAEPYIRRKAMSHLDKGRVVIFGGIASGLGNPLFTTDAAAALRASEINADVVLKGTTGDALYGCHPGSSNGSAFEHISYREFVSRGFTPMDTTAVAFCEENNIPVVLFNLLEPSNISRALAGDQIGTLIDQSGQIG